MRLTEARALCPDLRVETAAPDRDAAFLAGLGRWATRYTPWTAADGADGLLLDISGCAHLFGGEESLLADLARRLSGFGFDAHLALADTRGAAWGLARHGTAPTVICPAGTTRDALADLPPAALRLGEEVVMGMGRLGLERVGDLLALPRAGLARRFGIGAVRRLDQALGVEPEPLTPAPPPPSRAARLSLPEPIATVDAVMAAVDRLVGRLCARLETRGEGLRGLCLTLRRVDGGAQQTVVGLARASRDRALILDLCTRRVRGMDAGFGIDLVRVEVRDVEPLNLRQGEAHDLWDGDAPEASAHLDALLSRLGGRLGFDRLRRFQAVDTHLPDRRYRLRPIRAVPPPPGPVRPTPPRPLTLCAPEPLTVADAGRPPVAFHWRGTRFETVAAEGPERIAPEWWRDDPAWTGGLRDYWRVQTRGGRRLWLFHLPQRRAGADWFVQGEFP